MATPEELKKKFWKALKSDMTVMLGLSDKEHGHTRPMTAQVEGERGPIWFFTVRSAVVAQNADASVPAMFAFASKDHELFATVHGLLRLDNDRAVIERLWNQYIAAWYEGGKDDPKLALLRFEPNEAEIWLNETSLFAGIKLILGGDPKEEYKEKTAKVELS
ncbi:pyridoxamine 5'-phosphate oxidase family protein [Ensifer canadensis]